MLNLRHVLDAFDLRVDDAVLVLEEGRQIAARDVTVLVNGRRQDRAAVLFVPRGIIRPAAEERDAKRCACDDQSDSPDAAPAAAKRRLSADTSCLSVTQKRETVQMLSQLVHKLNTKNDELARS
jgi:hypothetical protein